MIGKVIVFIGSCLLLGCIKATERTPLASSPLPLTVILVALLMQLTLARNQEEAAARQATVEAQLKMAKDDLATAATEQQRLQQQLANAQDAVKVSPCRRGHKRCHWFVGDAWQWWCVWQCTFEHDAMAVQLLPRWPVTCKATQPR
jgi:hypothetical protein